MKKRAISNADSATVSIHAANNCVPIQEPDCKIAAATGGPKSKPKLATANELPSRVPITLLSLQREAITNGGRDRILPIEKPYKHEKTMQPAVVEIAIHTNDSSVAMKTAGIITLSPPIRSAIKFGAIRPRTEQAFNIGRR